MAFILSGFADEIDEKLSVQIEQLLKNDVHFVELRGADGKNVADLNSDEAVSIRARLDQAGIGVSALGSPIGKIGIGDDFAPHYEKFLRLLDTADLLGTKYIRMFSYYIPHGEDPETHFDEVCRRTAALLDAASARDVTLLHENEKGIYGDTAPRCEKLMKRFYCPHFAATFDPANFVQCGQRIDEAYELLRPYIQYVHIKDALFADGRVVPAGYGDGQLPRLLASLQKTGYDGFLSLEPHLGDFSGFAGLEHGASSVLPAFDPSTDAPGRFKLAADALKKLLAALPA